MDNSMKQTNIRSEGVSPVGLPAWKRVFDFLVLLLTLPIWLPLAVAVSLAVYIGSPGAVFFRQLRVGQRGSKFTCFKFRTMQVNASSSRAAALMMSM